MFHICDMIKGNESDVGDIVLEILAKKEVKFFCFYIVFSADKSFLTLQPRHPICMGFASKCSIFKLLESDVKNSKLKIFDM